MTNSIQIISFDNPYPPDYGGAVEVFYKIAALHGLGVEIDLHFFSYGSRKELGPLKNLCRTIHTFKRKKNIFSLISNLPFIVKSRQTEELLEKLTKNPAPILFEGLHCCYLLDHPRLKNHFKMVSAHNIEHEYYSGLCKNTNNYFKKFYYRSEAKKLKSFEAILSHADLILSLTANDAGHFEQYAKTIWLPAFFKTTENKIPDGDYVLIHGNLSVEENIQAVLVLVENVLKDLKHPVVIAGKAPHGSIIKAIQGINNIKLIADPTATEMQDLISDARCHLFYTNQNTGIKLKLVHAIQTSGHIIMNEKMLFDEDYRDEVVVAKDWGTMIESLNNCMRSGNPLPRPRLKALFNNTKNAETLLALLP